MFRLLLCTWVFATVALGQDSLNVRRIGRIAGFGESPGLVVEDTLVYVACQSGLRIVDIADPTTPELIGTLTSPGYCYGIAKRDNLIYLGSPDSGVKIVNVSNPRLPQVVGTFHPTPSLINGVAAFAEYILAADFNVGLRVVDADAPGLPEDNGLVNLTGQEVGVTIAGTLAFVGAMAGGLRIVDISNPDSIYEVGFYDTPDASTQIVVEDNVAYVADNGNLRIVDVESPTAPAELGHIPVQMSVQFLAVRDGYAYYSDISSGLRVVDCRDPANPIEIGHYNMAARPFAVAIAGDYVCVADESSFVIYEVSGVSPESDLTVTPAVLNFGSVVVGDSATLPLTIVSTGTADLIVNDILAPADFHTNFTGAMTLAPGESLRVQITFTPTLLQTYSDTLWVHSNASDSVVAVHLSGVGSGSSASEQVPLPQNFRIGVYPNPFNSSATITLDLPNQLRGRLVAYDALGRAVRTLVDGTLQAGSHEIRFEGNGLSSGNYFVRFESPQFSAVQKAVLVK